MSSPLLWVFVALLFALPRIFGDIASGAEGPASIGHIATPRGYSTSAWNKTYLAIALFEQLSTDVEVDVIERSTGKTSKLILPNSYIVYSMLFDRADPDILWIATSQRAALFKVRVSSGAIEPVAQFGDKKFIFAAGQHPSGDIYLGTYPDAKIYRVSGQNSPYKTTEISSLSKLVGARTYVKDVFTPETGFVFFHVGSPGALIAFDPTTGKSAEVLDTSDPFLFPARDVIAPISRIRSVEDFKPLPPGGIAEAGGSPTWAEYLFWRAVYSMKSIGFDLVVSHDGRETHLSELPRHGGMPITAFNKVSDDLAVGATYWNQWFFKLDLRSGQATTLGTIGRTGEFFTACGFEGRVIIPHYLGLLLSWEPDRPLKPPRKLPAGSSGEAISYNPGDNPRELLVRPDGHVGLDCLDAGGGRLVYSAAPTYSQETGQLWVVDMHAGGKDAAKVEVKRDPPQTINRLALADGKLYGGTGEFRGLGLRPLAKLPPMKLVELDPTSLNEIRSVELPVDQYRNTTGLVTLAHHRILVGTEGGGLYLVDTSADPMKARRIGPSCPGVSSLASLSSDTAVALCAGHVFVVDGRSTSLVEAATLPGTASFMAVGPNGDVIVTSENELIRIPSADIQNAAASAAVVASSGIPIGDGALEGYPLRSILAKDNAAWVSPLLGQAAIGHAYVGMDFGSSPEEIVGADVDWVLPPNTPSRVEFDYSDDGATWTAAASPSTTAAPSSSSSYWLDHFAWRSVGAHRFWRLTPLEGLRDHFAVEYLAFRHSPKPEE
jgi:hypothetical protein